MYKRRKRRGSKKGLRKQEQAPVELETCVKNEVVTSSLPTVESTDTTTPMSVAAMDIVDTTHPHHHHNPMSTQASFDGLLENKAVGARKRKPTQISKIVDKPYGSDGYDGYSEENEHHTSINNNNSPPYKTSCYEPSKNGIIRNILTELKSAKKFKNEEGRVAEPLSSGIQHSEDEDIDTSSRGNDETKCPDLMKRKSRMASNASSLSSGTKNKDWETGCLDLAGTKSNNGDDNCPSSAVGRYTDEENESGGEDIGSNRMEGGNNVEDEDHPFRCGVCAYGSCDKSTLLRHMRTHSGERPFQCRLCYFAFTTKANCERHLRNRHGKIDREQLRNLVVCFPSSSNGSESENESSSPVGGMNLTKSSGSNVESQNAPTQRKSSISTNSHNMESGDEPIPLDLSMDAMDLSVKKREIQRKREEERNSVLTRPKPIYPMVDVPSFLLSSPYVSKKEPMVHPQMPLGAFSPQNPMSLTPGGPHAPFSLFPFRAPAFSPFNIPQANMEKLLSLSSPVTAPPKLSSMPFMRDNMSASPKAGEKELLSPSTKEIKVKPDPIEPKTHRRQSMDTKNSTGSGTTSRKRNDPGNGEYQKPKQRRYRTERPFACPHCPARFTLRSNMERHGKHQHPTVWQRSPSNRVINRQKYQQNNPLVGPPTMVPNKFNAASLNLALGGSNSPVDKLDNSANNANIRAMIAQQLKRKLSNSSLRNNGSECETDGDLDGSDNGKVSTATAGSGDDLASVERLLDRVKSSNFAQYFTEDNGVPENLSREDDEIDVLRIKEDGDEDEDGMGRSVDGGSSAADAEESGDAGEEEEEEEHNKITSSGGVEKKKSAYSSAPHKISCPHCSRRFPWTSSLRRHLLTHTGQKPYQCTKCPLLFTTKSNCDRHLARKHNGARKTSSIDNSTEEDDEDEVVEEKEEERKTRRSKRELKSSTTEKKDNETNPKIERIAIKIPNVHNKISPSASSTQGNVTPSTNSSGEDAAFRCHLCEAAAGERDTLLQHMEEEHKDTYDMLVSKGALSTSPASELSETEQTASTESRDLTHRKVMCVFCVRRFWSVEDLRRHIRSHSGERPFSCPYCSRRFTLKHSMLRHLKKHAGSSTTTPTSSKESTGMATRNVTKALNASNPKDRDDLISHLLGIQDDQIVEQLLTNPDAQGAAQLLGLGAASSAKGISK